jgi:phosphopantothenoylcysteine decarboxylase/phosphopantothenate--cysteine ligase
MAAAVADYRVAEARDRKLKRSGPMSLELVPNPDLLAEIGQARLTSASTRPLLVGFALETASGDELVSLARGKLEKKRVDLMVANHAADSFDKDDNRLVLVTADRADALPPASKIELADRLLDAIAAQIRPRQSLPDQGSPDQGRVGGDP